jgi:carboxymethylenebutenolidase
LKLALLSTRRGADGEEALTNQADIQARAIALYDCYTHEPHDRRAFFAAMTKLAGGVAAANALIATIAADPAAATITAPADKRLTTSRISWPGAGGRTLKGYLAVPREPAGAKHGTVMVIHENRGLNSYVEDVARRVALADFVALAPDFLSPVGGTPADEDKARDMIGRLDLAANTADGVATIRWLKANKLTNGKVDIVGFCWGGAMVNRLAVAAGKSLNGGVAFYGPTPNPAEAAKVKAPLQLHYAGLDDRVNAGAGPWVAALKAAKVPVSRFDYPGVQHAFHNDTSAARYNAAAADLAWNRTIAFFERTLK